MEILDPNMRFSEKSFEIRFCAALSAALMPFNRNPQWFGLTQAQERKAGIDAMLRLGGKLIVFQFKAQDNTGYFRIEKEQLTALLNFTKRHKDSVFYAFSGIRDTKSASHTLCLFWETWISTPHALKCFFHGSSTKIRKIKLKIIPNLGINVLGSKNVYVQVSNFCINIASCKSTCFCFTQKKYKKICVDNEGNVFLFFMDDKVERFSYLRPIPSFSLENMGIPIGLERRGDEGFIHSVEQFEEMLGEKANKNLGKGLWGLFIPDTK